MTTAGSCLPDSRDAAPTASYVRTPLAESTTPRLAGARRHLRRAATTTPLLDATLRPLPTPPGGSAHARSP